MLDGTNGVGCYAQGDIAQLFANERNVLHIRQKTTTRFVVGVAYIVSGLHTFSGNDATACHLSDSFIKKLDQDLVSSIAVLNACVNHFLTFILISPAPAYVKAI